MQRMGLGVVALLALPGCWMFFMQMPRPSTVNSAVNPLRDGGGGVLDATAPSSDGFLRIIANAQACNVWPVGDHYSVEVSEARICITYEASAAVKLGEAAPASAEAGARDMNASAGGEAWKVKLQPDRQVHKVGECEKTSGDMLGTYAVWMTRYSGCIDNAGKLGSATAQLTVDGDVTWKFGG